jgi:rod shape determining protein RodA
MAMIFDLKSLKKLDLKVFPVICVLIILSLMIISSSTQDEKMSEEIFFTPCVLSQLRAFVLGLGAYFFFAMMDYRKLKDWSWILYFFMVLGLIGLFFTPSIQNVHRWYRIPGIPFALQPSELAKVVLVITLSQFLESKKKSAKSFTTCLQAGIIVLIPFGLILKQPDLGSALVLFPISLVMFYFGGIHPFIIRAMSACAILGLTFVALMFSGVLSYEDWRPIVTKVIKEYQYERFNPDTYHQRAGQTAIALGGLTGKGFNQSEFTKEKWLPFGHTDSVFSVFSEEFGLIGASILLGLFFALIYFSFQITAVACDDFGRLLSAGIAVYIAMHVIVNIGMMCGFLPITGVPLLLITYGGSSILATLSALGILQSIYTRRYMF